MNDEVREINLLRHLAAQRLVVSSDEFLADDIFRARFLEVRQSE